MSKPSLHELISKEIHKSVNSAINQYFHKKDCDELAEQIIKIVRDYHLVEDK
jgi:hypothetical protein